MKKQWFFRMFGDERSEAPLRPVKNYATGLLLSFLNDNNIGAGEFQVLPNRNRSEYEIHIMYYAESEK